MRNFFIGILAISYLLSCQEKDPARSIVLKSIKAHGGIESFFILDTLKYEKTTILYDSTGEIESHLIQAHTYYFDPQLGGTITWNSGETLHEVGLHAGLAFRKIDGEVMYDQNESALYSFGAATYVMLQPFKLLDPGTMLTYVGRDTLPDFGPVHVISASYNESDTQKEENDSWQYFFDQETNMLVANQVNHRGKNSLIVNLDYTSSGDIIWNAHRKSYYVDSLRNLIQLRAEYYNRNIIAKHVQ